MTRTDHHAAGREDVDWLLSEIEREGVPRGRCERFREMIETIIETGGARRCEVRSALRVHVAGQAVADDLPTPEERVLAAIAVLNPGALRRAQRLDRAVQLVKAGTSRRDLVVILCSRFGCQRREAHRIVDRAVDMAGELKA